MRETIKLGLTLCVVGSIAAAVLGISNEITSPVIKQTEVRKNTEARQSVLADAKEFDEVKVDNVEGIIEVFKGTNGGEEVGYTIKVEIGGFSGPVEILVGIDKTGLVTGMKVLSNSETPGLGKNAEKPEFQASFSGKNSKDKVEVSKTKPEKDNQVQAMTGATITTQAVADGVNLALDYFETALVQ